MKSQIIQNFLAQQISDPPNFIFLQDNSQILSGLCELLLHEILFHVIYFENDLQLRSELEFVKDDPATGNFCIISQKSENENRIILDYLYRSECIAVTPQAILNFSSSYHWSEAANEIKGDDFWRIIEALARIKGHPDLQLANPEEIYLAAALLELDVTRKFDMVSGTLFYFKTMMGNKYQNFKQNYPQLASSVEKKLFTDAPGLEPYQEQPDLIQQIWLKNIDSSRKITPYHSVDDLKQQLAIKAPLFVQDQINDLEKNYFTSPEEIENYLQNHLKADNIEGWSEYLKNENYLTEPLKIVIKRTIEYLLRNPDHLDLNKYQQMLHNLNTHHLIHTYFKKSPETIHPFVQVFKFFQCTVELFCIRKKIDDFLAVQSPDIQLLLQGLYPDEISRIPLLLETLQTSGQRHPILTETNLKKLSRLIEQSYSKIHDYFVDWFASAYSFSNDWFKQTHPGKTLSFQFIQEYLKENTTGALFVILFDGMRWDGWKFLQPGLERLFRNRQFHIQSMLLPIPSITDVGRPFVITGPIKSTAEWAAIQQAVPGAQIEAFTDYPSNSPDRMIEIIKQSKARIKIININLFDQRIHHSTLNLQANYEEIQREFQEVYVPLLEQLPSDSPVIICSDHGFIQVSGKWYGPAAGIINQDQPAQHRRYLALPEIQADKKHFAYFSEERLGLAEAAANGLAFLKAPVVFKIQQTEKFVRYAHGGISLEELVVPFIKIT